MWNVRVAGDETFYQYLSPRISNPYATKLISFNALLKCSLHVRGVTCRRYKSRQGLLICFFKKALDSPLAIRVPINDHLPGIVSFT